MDLVTKPSPIQVSAESPFANDCLDRRESIENLTRMLFSTSGPFVLCIDAAWGSGKTTFLRLWEAYLDQQDKHFLHFNAWENDFAEDPLISFIGEIKEAIDTKKLEKGISTSASKQVERLKRAGQQVLKRALPVAVKIASMGLMDVDEVTEQDLGNLAEKIAADQMNQYAARKDSVVKFRSELESFASQLSNEDGKDGDLIEPLLFFIDELDRCRPDYAVRLLERIKHLFNVRGIVFVLALDKEQLQHSIKAVYGEGMNASAYLRRFLDLEYALPAPESRSLRTFVLNQIDMQSALGQRSSNVGDGIVNCLRGLVEPLGLSLRDIQQVCTRLNVILRACDHHMLNSTYMEGFTLAFMTVLRIVNPVLYKDMLGAKEQKPELQEIAVRMEGKLGDDASLLVEAAYMPSQEAFKELLEKLYRESVEHKDREKRARVSRLSHFWGGENGAYAATRMTEILAKKISFSDRFNL
jgi:hypothetical protein